MTKLDRLQARIDELVKENTELRQDRILFREHFRSRFQWWISLMGEGKTPNMAWLIESDAKWLQRLAYWVW